MIFSEERYNVESFNFKLRGENIDIIQDYKYLGLLRWKTEKES